MGSKIAQQRQLKQKLPRLAAIYSDYRFLREFEQTTRLLHGLQSVASLPGTEDNGKTVVFNMGRTYVPYQVTTEMLLAMKLRQKGYRICVLYDDGILSHHDTLTKAEFKPLRTNSWFKRRISLSMLKRVPNVRDFLVPYSRFCENETPQAMGEFATGDETVFESIDLTPFVEASLVRLYLSAPDKELLGSEPDFEPARKMFVRNCCASLTVAKNVLSELKPDLMITSHGIYSTWGPFMQYMKDHGVRCISYGGNGYLVDAVDMAINDIAANKSDSGFFPHFVRYVENEPAIRSEIIEKVDSLMDGRIDGTANDVARFGVTSAEGPDPVLERVEQLKKQNKKVYGLFPNVMWDNATTFKEWNRVFDSPVEWLVETVRYIAQSEDKALVVRVHPAEFVWMPVRKSVVDILRCYLGDEIFDKENIIIVPPEQPLSSYRLFPHLTAGMVYNGTIGPELIYKGVPLIVGARAAYTDKGFTFDISGREEYFACLDRTHEIRRIQNENIGLAKLFLCEYFFLHGVPVKYLSRVRQYSPNWEGDPVEIWHDDNLEHLVATISGEKEFFQKYPEKPALV